jgi:hypothetical protein
MPSSRVATQNLSLTLYLKHFRDSTINYILKQTGYKSITEYEIYCRCTDSFPIQISVDGMISSVCPNVDTDVFCVIPLSIHHLYYSVLNHIMDKYVGMDQLDYELLYGAHNTIYVVVPYKEKWAEWAKQQEEQNEDYETEEDVSEEEWYEEVQVVQPKKSSKKIVIESSDSDDDVPLTQVNKKHTDTSLAGWKFKMNTSTKNSYILTPPQPVKLAKNGKVSWGSTFTPSAWNLQLSGLTRPVYYVSKYGGWIISLSLHKQLLSAGATQH